MIYEYVPTLKKKKEKLLSTLSLLLGAALFLGSMIPGFSHPWILQLFSFASFVVFVAVFSLCLMRSYVYTVKEGNGDEPDFIITEHYGRRITVVCRVSLSSVRSVAPVEKGKKKKHGQGEENTRRFIYTGIIFDEPRYLLEVEEAGERFSLCICADEALLQLLMHH